MENEIIITDYIFLSQSIIIWLVRALYFAANVSLAKQTYKKGNIVVVALALAVTVHNVKCLSVMN